MSDDLLREILREANAGDIFRRILVQARDAGTLVQVFANPQNLDQCNVGFVRQVGEENFILEEVTWDGDPDGKTAIALRHVLQISQNTRKLRRTLLLYSDGAFPDTDEDDGEEIYAEDAEDCVLEELERARSLHELVSVRVATEQDYMQLGGFIREIVDGYVQMEMLTTAGEPDGVATIRLADISCVMRNDRQHHAALRFYQHRQKLYGNAQTENPW